MAVWGIDAYYKDSIPSDKTANSLSDDCAYIGWDESDASALYRMFDSVKIGDIIYIKSFAPHSKKLHINAVGIVSDSHKCNSKELGTGLTVR